MIVDWFSILFGWLGGIPTGLFANWLFHKLSTRKRTKGDYFTVTYTKGSMHFEGQQPSDVEIGEIVGRLFGSEQKES